MANTLPVSRVVSVDVLLSPKAAATRNFGSMLILGDSNVIPASERIRTYSSISEVMEDFATTTPEYLACVAFFSQSPKPKTVQIGRWTASAETLLDAVKACLEFNSWYGLFVAADRAPEGSERVTVADCEAISQLIEAAKPSRIIAWNTQDEDELSSESTSTLGYRMHKLNLSRTLVAYSSTSKYAAASILGRMSTVNFEGNNTCITLKFKQLPGLAAEGLTTTKANVLSANCVNVFAAYDNDTSILQEGVMSNGYFIDEIHGLDWLQNRVETDLWNLLYTSGTKVGQDEPGMNRLVATVSRSLEQGVTNGLVAPGVWNGDGFGALEPGATLPTGFYVYIQPLDEQAQSDREARKAPPIQCAIKLRGAVHFADVTITVNR